MIGKIKLNAGKRILVTEGNFTCGAAKMLSRCSVRIHGCAGSPADYPNTVLSWKVLRKLSCFYGLKEPSNSVQLWTCWLSYTLFLWIGRSSSQSLAEQPFTHSCSIFQLSCQKVWYVQRHREWSGEAGQHSEWHGVSAFCKILLGTMWQRTWELVSS